VSEDHLEESALLRLVVGELPPAEREGAERHLWACAACRDAFRASERLDAVLRAAGPALSDSRDEATSLSAADPFARRPEAPFVPPRPGAETRSLAEAAARAVPEARELASKLSAEFEVDDRRGPALSELDLGSISGRLALAYVLDEAAVRAEEDAPRRVRLSAAVLDRLSSETGKPESDAQRVMSNSDLQGRALLLSGAAGLFSGDFDSSAVRLLAAWRAFGDGRASEPLLARTEALEALRRVGNGRWPEAEALADRAGETFELTGAGADAARVKLASGLALWGSGQNRRAVTLLRKAALGFGRAESWGGFVTAACAAALCLAADGRVEESRHAFRELRRRKARRAPLAERMFVRETERIALLLVREPGKKKGPAFSFSPGDVVLLRAASALAEGVVAAARESDEKLDAALRVLDGDPARAFALLYGCQKAALLVVQDPLRALELARAVFDEPESITGVTRPLREVLKAEANLLESQAQNQLGYAKKARVAAAEARDFFRASGDMGFGLALAFFHEGSAASFAKDYVAGERLLKKALKVFAESGQNSLMGRAEGALGTLYMLRGDEVRALPYFDHAAQILDPVEDVRPLTMTLNNRANVLVRLGRFDEARASYARALNRARRNGSTAHIQTVRSGLAFLDFQKGQWERALRAYVDLRESAREAGWENEVVFASLHAAECLGHLGRETEMVEEITTLRIERKANPFASSPAMDELFACLDQGMVDRDLVAHVRSYLEDEANGVDLAYWRLKIVG
jgi:tetratricopeptide (TPR) repeat protein